MLYWLTRIGSSVLTSQQESATFPLQIIARRQCVTLGFKLSGSLINAPDVASHHYNLDQS